MLLTLFQIALQLLSISTASTADALAIETAATNLAGIDPPLLLPPHLEPTLLVDNNNNPPLDDHICDHNSNDNDNDFNGANDVEPLAVDPLADGVDALVASGVGLADEARPVAFPDDYKADEEEDDDNNYNNSDGNNGVAGSSSGCAAIGLRCDKKFRKYCMGTGEGKSEANTCTKYSVGESGLCKACYKISLNGGVGTLPSGMREPRKLLVLRNKVKKGGHRSQICMVKGCSKAARPDCKGVGIEGGFCATHHKDWQEERVLA